MWRSHAKRQTVHVLRDTDKDPAALLLSLCVHEKVAGLHEDQLMVHRATEDDMHLLHVSTPIEWDLVVL